MGPAAARTTGEYEVKAAYLLNFAKFVEWPSTAFADESAPVVIGVVGDDPFGDTLRQIVQDQTAQKRRITIQYFKPGDDFSASHILFISRSEANRTSEILERVKNRPVLTISEHEDFLKQGGMIDFVIVKETVRFDISARVLEKAGLKASSKLLAVARSVVKS